MLSHQETMNPGTTLFIAIGIIGLMLYVLKAIRPSLKESFSSSVGSTDINTFLTAFGTPDVTAPSLLNINTPELAAVQTANIENPQPTPSLSISAALPALTAIPAPSDNVQTQAPIIPEISNSEGPSKTISDLQGANQKKEAFETQKSFTEAMNGKPIKKPLRKKKCPPVKKCPPMPDMTLYIR
jgi:hypothetical protein